MAALRFRREFVLQFTFVEIFSGIFEPISLGRGGWDGDQSGAGRC